MEDLICLLATVRTLKAMVFPPSGQWLNLAITKRFGIWQKIMTKDDPACTSLNLFNGFGLFLSVRDEFHTTSAYSKRGCMYPLYTVISSSFLKPNLFNILNIYRWRLVLEIISEIFLSHERSCWSQTPSIFAWSTKLREQPLIFNSVAWGTSVFSVNLFKLITA